MRLTCDSADLAAALGVVARAISPRTSLPVLGMVLLETTDGGLCLAATNLELGIRRWIDADVEAEGAVAVPGRLLADFTSAMPRERVCLELDGPDQPEHVLLVRSSSFRTRVHGVAADEFPPAMSLAGGRRLAIPARRLVEAITDTLVTASADEARPVLTGVHLALDGSRLVLTASDGYRLAVRPLELGPGCAGEGFGITVPARTLAEVVRLLRHLDGELLLTVSPQRNQVLFQGPGLEITSRVIDGRYPDHRRLVPAASATTATVAAPELSRRLRALTPFAQGSANVVRLGVMAGSVVLSAAATDVGSAQTDLEAAVAGPDTAVAFNARYLLDCPALATDDRVQLHLAGPTGPVVVRRTTDDGYVYLFMPVRHGP
jgi:DNA polymerase-3 subunit beta